MNIVGPIYTQKTECQDCYKCVRHCPFKAIKIENGHAIIIIDKCVYCGRCVEVCPANAKRIRNDVSRVELLFSLGKKVIASLAPSYISEFDCSSGRMVTALKKLGFYGVSETAIGAEILSRELRNSPEDKNISVTTACPVVTGIMEKYYPEAVDKLSDKISPVLVHCNYIKERFGDDFETVFIGPCMAKKIESDKNPSILNVAITWDELREWLARKEIDIDSLEESDFITETSIEGNFYPIDGGFLRTIGSSNDALTFSYSGIENVKNIFNKINDVPAPENRLIIEALACEGGCINGPCSNKDRSPLEKKILILNRSANRSNAGSVKNSISIKRSSTIIEKKNYPENEIESVLKTIGKQTKQDELNCGGCGYDSCREFAGYVLAGIAEKEMCVTHNRRLAQKKANALIRTIPSGLVITNENLKIIECNRNFVTMFMEDDKDIFDIKPGLEGALLEKTVPKGILNYFEEILVSGTETLEHNIKTGKKFIHLTLFTIEKNRIVGGVFQDVTSPMVQKRNIIEKAQNVIHKNLKTVQTIANLLGENAADTEVILNSIIESFDVNDVS